MDGPFTLVTEIFMSRLVRIRLGKLAIYYFRQTSYIFDLQVHEACIWMT